METTVLDLLPGGTIQIDFGKGSEIIYYQSGDLQKTWFRHRAGLEVSTVRRSDERPDYRDIAGVSPLRP